MSVLPLLRSQRVLGILTVLACILWGAILILLVVPEGVAPPGSTVQLETGSDIPVTQTGAVVPMRPPDTPNWSNKPLFEPERRIAVGESEAQPAPVAEARPDLILTGVVIDGSQKLAVLQDQISEDSVILAPGGRFKGWRLEDVSAEQVNLSLGARSIKLELFADDGRARTGFSLSQAPQSRADSTIEENAEATETPAQASF